MRYETRLDERPIEGHRRPQLSQHAVNIDQENRHRADGELHFLVVLVSAGSQKRRHIAPQIDRPRMLAEIQGQLLGAGAIALVPHGQQSLAVAIEQKCLHSLADGQLAAKCCARQRGHQRPHDHEQLLRLLFNLLAFATD